MVKLAVVIPYFNPAGYVSHERKLARCLTAYQSVGLAEHVYLTGAGGPAPLGLKTAFWDEDCPFLWHKERLINLAAERLPSEYTHVVWSDSDILVGPDWADAVTRAFHAAKLVQAFRVARYRGTDGTLHRTRVSSLLRGDDGAMGLVWGACRTLFTDGPGLFDRAVVGGGDSILGRAVHQRYAAPSVPWLRVHRELLARSWSSGLLAEQDAWVAAAARWLGTGGVASASADIEVLEHGTREMRRYSERQLLLAELLPALHLVDDGNRVLRWSALGMTVVEPGVRAYFHSRREDEGAGAPAVGSPMVAAPAVGAQAVAAEPAA
ncbi:hypothetical protein [Yinghuangia seranimata]|uniref:hypothetical protein n=1 Tax=Yinghuangia seranimata TaxID=408067 RepID=UPI00248C7585|nr:hypothetical protein [Yinghuangia seranimata]MDI2127006.1 hypothetical protein [Yinghuangia seranimata]